MKRIERWLTAGVVALVVLVGIAAQAGLFSPGSVGGALFGSVAGIDVPALDDPAMIRRGAAHYERVCANCHASPDRPDRAESLELTPPPPKLHLRIEGWPPEFLFAIVRHGIDNTAMPAWPTEDRDDEVWDMVAFLMTLPSISIPDYRELTGLDVPLDGVPLVAQSCVRCHASDGHGFPDGASPRLNIQSETYLASTLKAFREGDRASGFMQSIASSLRDDEIAALAAYFSSEPLEMKPSERSTTLPDTRRVPACSGCHGDTAPVRPEFPALYGQYEAYLLRQLQLFAEGSRGGGPFVSLMHEAARKMTLEDAIEASKWFGTPTGKE